MKKHPFVTIFVDLLSKHGKHAVYSRTRGSVMQGLSTLVVMVVFGRPTSRTRPTGGVLLY